MGFLKSLFLVICVLVLFIAFMVFEFGFMVTNTVLSNTFFTKIINNGDIVSTLFEISKGGPDMKTRQVAQVSDDEGVKPMGMISSYAGDTVTQWLKTEIPVIISGIHAYIVGSSDELPVSDITGVKSALIDKSVDELMARPEYAEQLQHINELIKILNDEYLDRLLKNGADDKIIGEIIGEIMKSSVVMDLKLDAELLGEILESYLGLKKEGASGEQLVRGIVSDITENESLFGMFGNSIDISFISGKLFGAGYDPVEGLRGLILGFKRLVVFVIPAIILLMILIFAMVIFRTSGLFKWTAIGFILTGMVLSAVAILIQYMAASGDDVFGIFGDSAALGVLGAFGEIRDAIISAGGFMLIEGVLTVLAGLILLLAGLLASEKAAARVVRGQKQRAIVYRAPAFIIAAVLIVVLAGSAVNNTVKSVREFTFNSSQTFANLNGVDILELVSKK